MFKGNLALRDVCKHCKTDYKTSNEPGINSGTGHLTRHLAKCLPLHLDENDPKQAKIILGSAGVGNFTYSQSRMREGLADFIVNSKKPLALDEDEDFEEFIQLYLQPAYKKVSRNTSRTDILKKFDGRKNLLIAEFASHATGISFTSDMWTGCNGSPYICVTSHYIDAKTWMLIKKVIAFRTIPYPRTGRHIHEVILNILKEYGVESKNFSLGLDNAAANVSAIGLDVHVISFI